MFCELFNSFWDFWNDQKELWNWLALIDANGRREERIQEWRAKKKFFVIGRALQVWRIESCAQCENARRRANSMMALKRIVAPIVITIIITIRI